MNTLHSFAPAMTEIEQRYMPKVRTKVETLTDLINALRIVFEEDHVNIELVTSLLQTYSSNPRQWKTFAKFDKFKYTRNLVDEGNGKYNLMLLCWGEGQGSAIHDHANAHCFMKILAGSLQEARFDWPSGEGPLQQVSVAQLNTGDVCYINDSLGLHRVENPSSTDPAVSLHLYCPPFQQCCVFNQQTGRKAISRVTFWSKFGNRPDRKIQDERPPEDN